MTIRPARDRSRGASLRHVLIVIGPGLMVAATGVGAGDLATAAFTGSRLGVTVLWAVAVGAFFKYVLTEGLARWQLATGSTLLEGCMTRLGWPFQIAFLAYLLPWSFFVGSALMSACGVCAHALLPILDTPFQDKVLYAILHSAAGTLIVRAGGFRVFEHVIRICIGLMFVTVLVSAALVRPDLGAVFAGLFVPRLPSAGGEGLVWTVALMGGVGGTLTILCYGYWIREKHRETPEAIWTCRIDLSVGYFATALFGMAMVIIGSGLEPGDRGASLIVNLGAQLEASAGAFARWTFLIGAWCAVFSSLLGVWQAVPYIFADFMAMRQTGDARATRTLVSTASPAYRAYLYALAIVPVLALFAEFEQVQKVYAVFGAFFMPFLAAVLLYLNGKRAWVGPTHTNRPAAVVVLALILVFFLWTSWLQTKAQLGLG